MKIVDRLQLVRFTRQGITLSLALIVLLTFYVLGRVSLRQEQLSWHLYCSLLIYSFAEISPVMVALNAHLLQRYNTRRRDHDLLTSYRKASPCDAWRLWPALLPCFLFTCHYIYFIKPELKQNLKNDIQFYQTDATHPVALSGGWLWKNDSALWSKFNDEEQIHLHSKNLQIIKGALSFAHGTIDINTKVHQASMTFEQAHWPTHSETGIRWLTLSHLISHDHRYEIWHRFNLPLLLITLTFLGYHLGQTKHPWAPHLFALTIFAYLISYHLMRNSEAIRPFPLLAISPALIPILLLWCTRLWK
jgi:hypothetical protein